MSFLLTKSPVLGSVEHYNDILNNLPIGIVVLTQEFQFESNEYIISNSNQIGRKLLSIPKDNNIKKFIKSLNDYQEFSFSQNKKETSLYEHIFLTKESSNKTFIHNNDILYIKVRRNKFNIYILIDNYEDERKNIQNQYVKNIGYQYLLTLYHEINNPVNSLLSTVNEIPGNFNSNSTKRIELLVYLIRFFLKNFILYFQISSLNVKDKFNLNSTINLESIFARISEKFSMLFEYKRITQIENISLLSNKCANLDYFYFKNLIKMIYLYFYKRIPKEGKFLVNAENTNENNSIKITFSNKKINERTRSYSNAEIINLEQLNISNLSSNIQTQKMTENIIKKILTILHIQNEYNFDTKNIYISIIIPIDNEMKFGNENELDELSPEHLDTMRLLSRSVTSPTVDNTTRNNENEIQNFNSENSINSISNKSSISEEDEDEEGSEYYNLKIITPKRNKKRFNTIQMNNKINCKFKNRLSTNSNNEFFKKVNIRRRKTVLEILKKNYFNKENENKFYYRKTNRNKKVSNNNLYEKLNQSRHHSMFQLRNLIDKEKGKDVISEEEKSLNESHSAIITNQFGTNKTTFINIKEYRLNFQKDLPVIKKTSGDFSKKIKRELLNQNINISNNNIPSLVLKNQDLKNEKKENCCNDVLIVDDEQFNVSCLSNNLKKLNILCDSCSDGIECLDLIKKRLDKNCLCKKCYKLILMDLIMPKMNGIEAVKHIQDLVNENKIDSEYLNVVFISANIDQKDSLQDIQKKYPIVKGFLTKPVKITKIQDMIKRFYYD